MGCIYTYQSSRFPITSIKGRNYVFLLYDNDPNSILTYPLFNPGLASMAPSSPWDLPRSENSSWADSMLR